MADRAKFDEWIERQINEDQEIGGYDAETYAGEMLANLDLTDDRETAEDEGRPWVDDLEEARGRVDLVVARELPRIQAERDEVESEPVADWPPGAEVAGRTQGGLTMDIKVESYYSRDGTCIGCGWPTTVHHYEVVAGKRHIWREGCTCSDCCRPDDVVVAAIREIEKGRK